MTKIKIGTRGSQLALIQTKMVTAEIEEKFPYIKTEIWESTPIMINKIEIIVVND